MELISALISEFNPARPNFRPTEIYNENWLIKIVMDQAASINDINYIFGFLPKSTWYSEGLLPTAFKGRFRGDPLSESRTHADGVIGHIRIGHKAKADLELLVDAQQFTVVEAKMGAPFSHGTRNAKYFDQAARSIACMAEVISTVGIDPVSLKRLDFILLAPKDAIDNGTFSEAMKKSSIQEKVNRRVKAYEGQLGSWYKNHFEPTLGKVCLHTLSWESILKWISDNKPGVADKLIAYYELCLKYK